MPLYEYICPRCGDTWERFNRIEDRLNEKCSKCRRQAALRMSRFMVTKDKLFEFVDYNTTGKPVVINSKGQWKKHLKSLGMHDDVKDLRVGEKPDVKPKKMTTAERADLKKEIYKAYKMPYCSNQEVKKLCQK